MFCPNCGKELTGEYCSNCGNKFTSTAENNDVNNCTREELLNAYAGKNAEKVYNRSWNWSAFFFGPVYYLYRKLWLEGAILFVINTIFNLLFKDVINSAISLFISLVITVFVSILFCKFYTNKANKKIDTILSYNLSKEQTILECQRAGGTATWVAAVFGVLYGILFVIMIISIFFYGLIWPSVKDNLTMNTCENLCPSGEVNSITESGACICGDGSIIDPDNY